MNKKILTVSFYSDFARFFNEISKKLDGFQHVSVSLYPSAYFYNKIKGVNTYFAPLYVRRGSIKCEINTEMRFDKYHQVSEGEGFDEELFSDIQEKYLAAFERLLSNERPDLVVLAGDSRLPIEVLKYLCELKKIKHLFFEQGPCGTTILDSVGVNANCSFRNASNFSDNGGPFERAINMKRKKWSGYKKYRLIDYLCDFLGLGKIFPELYVPKLTFNKHSVKLNSLWGSVNAGQSRKYFLLVLQVPEDVNMIYHSPYFESHIEILKSVYSSLPRGLNLVVREHPLYKGRYERLLYDFIDGKDDIYLDDSASLVDLLDKAALVFVNNSTVGIEAIIRGKQVVVVGNAYYDHSVLCFKYNGVDLSEAVERALESPLNPIAVERRVNFLFESCFIYGHFRDLDNSNFIHSANKISDYVD